MNRWPIPESWKWIAIGEIADVVGGGTPSVEDDSNFAETGIPWITPADLSGFESEYIERGRRSLSRKGLEGSSARLLPPGTVLFTSRAPIGYCAIAANELSTNQGFKNFVLYGGINPRYVRLYLLGAKDYAESLASGTTFKELSAVRAASLSIPIAPVGEQGRLVDRVLALRARTAKVTTALEAIERLTEEFRRSVLARAFRGDLTVAWREQHDTVRPGSALLREFKRTQVGSRGAPAANEATGPGCDPRTRIAFDAEGLPSLPNSWCWAAAEDVIEPEAGLVYGILQPGENVKEGVPYVQGKDIRAGEILLDQLARTRPAIAQSYQRTRLGAGDVVLSIIRDTKVAIVPKALEGGNLSRSVALLRPSRIIRSTFLARWLASPYAQRWLHRRFRGIDMPGLNLRDVRRLPIPVAPLEEQVVIEQTLDEMAKPVASVAAAASEANGRCDELNRAILTKAFQGRLSDQRSDEESGSKVVDRAQSERLSAANARKAVIQARGTRKMAPKPALETVTADIRAWIQAAGNQAFTFDELRREVPHSYEHIKEAVFAMLRNGETSLRQVFNDHQNRMELRGASR